VLELEFLLALQPADREEFITGLSESVAKGLLLYFVNKQRGDL
jgi:hypothetical protein